MGDVGNPERDLGELGLHLGETLLGRLESVAQLGHLIQQGLDVLTRRLGAADGLGPGVALALQLLGFHLDLFAALLEGADTRGIQRVTAARQLRRHQRQFISQQSRIQH